ncbi:uncharacterized protein DFL_000061 [Arthrobotrys flagrans]|uniref:Integrase catalytic domain-containing protein n=1 Tax=Arthrobotrys flagrans TaxID=97331 RepID=A0A437AD56_ARTFL|nr:hypothetical protein DFL_000061 [Arthrobotrys flagrans]
MAIHLNNAKEFIQKKVQTFCAEYGIEIKSSAPYAHEQNGTAERAIQTLRELATAILIESGLPEVFWQEALSTACFTSNRLVPPKRKGEQTPKSSKEQLNGNPVDYTRMHPFGYLVVWNISKKYVSIVRDVVFVDNSAPAWESYKACFPDSSYWKKPYVALALLVPILPDPQDIELQDKLNVREIYDDNRRHIGTMLLEG